jgi:hypothetical protein
MKPTRTLSSYVLLVGIMGLSIVGGLVAYQIYSASTKSQITKAQEIAIKPLDGVINQSTIDNLKKRTIYTDTQMGTLINAAPTPEATIAAVKSMPVTATPSATPTLSVSTSSATTQ